MQTQATIKVWDPLVRIFHWTLVLAFSTAYLTEDDWMTLHSYAGYLVAGLVAFRIIWGLIGTRHARFNDFIYRPSTIIAYLKDVLAFRARNYLGHNPAGGAMVIALLLMLALTTATGMATYGAKEFAGPLAGMLANTPDFWADALEDMHEFFANATLLLVLLHIAGVALASFQHGENLARSMVTGRKNNPENH